VTTSHASRRALTARAINPRRLAAFALAAGIGIAACSPSGASTNAAAGPTPTTATTTPMNMTAPPATGPAAGAAVMVAAGAQAKVSITNFAFDPAVLSVKVGTKIVWTNNDIVAHTVTFTDVANSPVLNRGATFSRTFTAPGTYSYICSIHPFMHGSVVVTA
jgi:plastocyanin